MGTVHRLIGRAARLYWRVRRPRTLGVRAILLDAQERVALVRHSYIDQWYLPGGGVKKGESFEAAIYREIREEVAIDTARIERIGGVFHSRNEGKDDHIVIFILRLPPGAAEAMRAADAMEIEAVGWFPIDALPTGTSAATARRIAEYAEGRSSWGSW